MRTADRRTAVFVAVAAVLVFVAGVGSLARYHAGYPLNPIDILARDTTACGGPPTWPAAGTGRTRASPRRSGRRLAAPQRGPEGAGLARGDIHCLRAFADDRARKSGAGAGPSNPLQRAEAPSPATQQ